MPDAASTEGDPLPDNWLFDLYRQYIGEPDEESDVYLGFGLFFGGIAFAAMALMLFVWSGTYQFRTDPYFVRAGPAYALGMLAVPAVLLGVVVLLPTEDRARWAATGGASVTALAVGAFLWAYPSRWMSTAGADHTVPIVAVYAVGLTVVIGSTGAALVANMLQRGRPPSFEDVEESRDEDGGESWTDEEIRQDIDEAMSEADINWGGVEESDNRSLNLQVEEIEVDTSGMEATAETTRMEGVDDQVSGLKQLKGGEKNTAKSEDSTVDDQTAALNELKRKKREGEAPADPGEDGGVFGRIRGILK